MLSIRLGGYNIMLKLIIFMFVFLANSRTLVAALVPQIWTQKTICCLLPLSDRDEPRYSRLVYIVVLLAENHGIRNVL